MSSFYTRVLHKVNGCQPWNVGFEEKHVRFNSVVEARLFGLERFLQMMLNN